MNKNVNCRLKELRRKNKMTQKDLGKLVNVSSDYISQLERGRLPGMGTAIKLAIIFDTTLEDLFFDPDGIKKQ